MSPVISIIMPVKNATDYLPDCIDSIIAQTFADWELIAVDDHSDDNSIALLSEYSSIDRRIKCLPNKGQGIIDALSTAFGESKGEFISRMDADDIMPKEKLAKLFQLCRGTSKTVASGKVKYFSSEDISDGYVRYENWLNGLLTSEDLRMHLYRECVIASPNWMVHRTCFESDISIEKLVYPEDYDLVFKWFDLGYKFKLEDTVTHLWREHPERTSRNSEHYQQKSFFKLKTNHFIVSELDENEES